MKTIKIPWLDFIEAAIEKLTEKYPYIGQKPEAVKFMRNVSYEGDCECWERPDYAEIEIS